MTTTPQEHTTQGNVIPFAHNTSLHFMIGFFVLALGLTGISPTDRMHWLADASGLIAILAALAFTYKKYRFSNRSYLLMLIFFCLHLYAAQYTYESTPFDHWLKNTFHMKRGLYDRVVHFCFGLLLTYPIRELLVNKVKIRGIWSSILTWFVILGISALFEVGEMLGALIVGKSGEARFVGMQGDIFDTQKDMAAALVGGLLTLGILWWMHKRQRKAKEK